MDGRHKPFLQIDQEQGGTLSGNQHAPTLPHPAGRETASTPLPLCGPKGLVIPGHPADSALAR